MKKISVKFCELLLRRMVCRGTMWFIGDWAVRERALNSVDVSVHVMLTETVSL